MWDELQLPVSFGIAANKLVAQIASKLRKPRGFVVVPPGTEEEFLAPLALGKLPGIGAKTEAALAERHGLKLVRDITAKNESELQAIFGPGWREMLAMARGEDERAVETEHEDAKSYSQQETFGHDIADFAEIERVAKRMVDELLPKIREDRKRVRTMTVKIRYPDFTQGVARPQPRVGDGPRSAILPARGAPSESGVEKAPAAAAGQRAVFQRGGRLRNNWRCSPKQTKAQAPPAGRGCWIN